MAVDDRKTKSEMLAEILATVKTNIKVSELKTLMDTIVNGQGSIMYYETMTGFIGGTDTDVDSIPTISKDIGTKILVIINGFNYTYELISGTTGKYNKVYPIIIHPNDHNADTNKKVWICRNNIIPHKITLTALQVNALIASPQTLLNAVGTDIYMYIDRIDVKNIFGTKAFVSAVGKYIYVYYLGDINHIIDLDKTWIENEAGEVVKAISGLGPVLHKNKSLMISYSGDSEIIDGDGGKLEFIIYLIMKQ